MKSSEYVGPLVVELGEHRDRDLLDVLDRLALRRVHEALVERLVLDPAGALLAVHDLGEEVRVTPLGVHVGDAEEAVEVVEPDVLRLALLVLAHVPLAHRLGDVPRVGEQLGDGDLALEATRFAVHRRPHQAVTHRQPAGHQRRARRRARRLRVARRHQQALAGEPVQVRSRRPDRDPAAVATEVAPADVVEDDHQHVRALAVLARTRPAARSRPPPARRARSAARGARPSSRSVRRSDRGP